MTSATYDAANCRTAQAGKALTYDLAGNLTKDAATKVNSYVWNARGELESMSGGVAASFTYDPFGRRQRKTVAGEATDYV